jgi:hypothetical protein
MKLRHTAAHRDGGSGLHSQWCVCLVEVTHMGDGRCVTFKQLRPDAPQQGLAEGGGVWVGRGAALTLVASETRSTFADYQARTVCVPWAQLFPIFAALESFLYRCVKRGLVGIFNPLSVCHIPHTHAHSFAAHAVHKQRVRRRL